MCYCCSDSSHWPILRLLFCGTASPVDGRTKQRLLCFLCSCPFSPHSYLTSSFHTADRVVLLWTKTSHSAILLKRCQSFPLPSDGKANSLKRLVRLMQSGLPDWPGLPSCQAHLPSLQVVFLAVPPTQQTGTFASVFLPEMIFLLGIHMTHPLLKCHLIRDTFPSTNTE